MFKCFCASFLIFCWSATQAFALPCPSNWVPPTYLGKKFDPNLYPFIDQCINLGFGAYHYFDETPNIAEIKGTVLMVSGNPTSSFVYRTIARNLLLQGYRVIAPDHYGFGLSAKPTTDLFGYNPGDHAQVLEQFVEQLNLQNVTLMVQDWGGPLGLWVAGRHPERVKNLVIMNTWAWKIDAFNPGDYFALQQWSVLNQTYSADIISNAYNPRQVGLDIGALYGPNNSPAYLAVRNSYWLPFINLATKRALTPTVAAPTNILPVDILLDSSFLQEAWSQLSNLTSKPVYFLYGRRDPYFGALTANTQAQPSCPSNTEPTRRVGTVNYCLRNGSYIYPYLDNFLSIWEPEQVKGTFRSLTSKHFIQEYEPAEIINAVNILNGY